MTAKARVLNVSVALVLHAVFYSLAVHPMLSAPGDSGLAYLLPSAVLYFPVSVVAWGIGFITHSTEAVVKSLAIGGALWYGFIGYRIGARYDRRTVSGST